ncbi:Predicted DNA binding protein, contains HTH domain [Natronoarchaeum philippinense]|uniref:Predicted DNA binding protein, contains HTH domain n=1 Tax=Natronoarchaeum philippinense TaxID=558529 RepID=A0A285NBP9_NATPI|nr:helix-turn-helix domain-containing protein [Natronoarchaeum philippinense]SNZ06860.1 Predicted DNA binding protein, contains HTH domain [Natronoarchaeum philippinense]
MIDVAMDMEQYDCPFIDTTDDYEVSFTAIHWQFDGVSEQLETRLAVDGESRTELEQGLTALQNHDNMRECSLFSKRDDDAVIRTVIDQTDAMQVIRDHGGYITGPFHIEDGSERWEVGFDEERVADDTLSDLERNNEFTVESRESLGSEELFDLLENAEPALALLEGCRDLSSVERDTLTTAAEQGYFEDPRGATLQSLADEFDVSDTAVSKNLRRGERKLLRQFVAAIEQLE